MTLIRIGHVLDLGFAPAKLHCRIAIPLLRAGVHHLQIIQMQHCHRHMGAVVLEQPGHAQLLRKQSGSHRPGPLQLDLDVHAGR